jgi:hypothetical protein
MTVEEILIDIQEQVFKVKGQRTDAHYKQGKGVIFVPEGYPLSPQLLAYQKCFYWVEAN